MLAPQNTEFAWRPIPGTSQELALDSRCHVTLYTGTRGPGKTDVQLMRFRRLVGKGYGSFWRGILIDKEYKNLDDLVLKSKRWFYGFDDGAQFLSNAKDYKWIWPTGEELLFRSMKANDDYWGYHGHEFPFIGWNELAKYPTSFLMEAMMSTNRSSFTPEINTPDYPITSINQYGEEIVICDKSRGILLPSIPLEVFATTNPYGVGHNWVKRQFIDPAPYGRVIRKKFNVFNPRTKQYEDIERTQVTFFGTYRENIYLDPIYIASLENDPDPNRRKAWAYGDWDIVAGGAIDDVWNRAIHVMPRFKIPEGWFVDRAFDWGSTHPFCVGWFAEANGEEAILSDGTSFCPPPGTLIQLAEWYGTREIGTNQGLRLAATDIAQGIINRETILMNDAWIQEQPWPGPADNQIRDVRETDVDTIESKMAKLGVRWLASDKSQGSRKNGLQLVRDRLQAAKEHKDEPRLYFMENCIGTIATLPTLPRDEVKLDDVDTEAEDHPYDVVRYRVTKGSNRYARAIKVTFPT